ncbi:hypothetical protein JCM11491_006779 [Sporobolomyces phaffii]
MSASSEAVASTTHDGHAVTASNAEPSTSRPMAESELVDPSVASSTSTPPVRPPKAAKRPSTASLATPPILNTAAVEGAPLALGAPAVAGDAQTAQTNNREEQVAAEQGNGVSTGSKDLREDERTAATVSTTADSSETVSSKPGLTTASDPKPSTSTAPVPAPATTSRATPSTSKPTTSSKTPKKKRKGPFAFLFACVPCISDPGHDDSHELPSRQQSTKPAVPSASAPAVKTKDVEKVAPVEPVSQASQSSIDEKSGAVAAPVEPEAAITPPTTEPVTSATPSTPVAPPPPSSSPSPQGVTLPREETEGVTSGAVVPPGQAVLLTSPPAVAPKSRRRKSGKHPHGGGTDGIITSVPEPGARQGGIVLAGAGGGDSDSSEDGSEEDDEEEYPEEEEEDEEQSLIARGGVGIPIGEDGLPHPLLDELSPDLKGRKCLVLDLDETLVHSSFKMVHQADYVVPVEIENQFHNVYVIKRPGVDGFLKAMGEIYEVVVFTASLSKYADPVLDQLDIHRVVKHRLFRESCYNNKGNYVKDLSQLGRPIDECIIIDNSPASYVFHVNNAVPISSWFNDPHDTELTDLVPFLTDLSTVDDVRSVLDAGLYQNVAQNGTDDVFNQI